MTEQAIDPIDLRTFPPVTPLTRVPQTWRQTFLAKQTECPRSAYLYLKYNGGALSHALARGTLFHRAMQRYIQHLFDENESYGTPEIAKDILNEVVVESTDLTVPPGEQDSLRAMMFHVAEGLAIEPGNLVALETPFTLEVDGRAVTGIIDYAETGPEPVFTNRLYIKDWKTAFLPYLPDKEEWGGSFQLVLYALGAADGILEGSPFRLDHIEEFVIQQVHPRHFWENQGTMAYREATISRDALLDWRLYLRNVVAQVERSVQTWEWPAIQGSHCDYCPASAECPIPAALRNWRGEIRTAEDARRAAELWEALGRRRTDLWNAVRGYSKATGQPVRYGKDLELSWKTIETEKIKDRVKVPGGYVKGRDALKDAVQRAVEWGQGFEWTDYFTPSISTRLQRRRLTEKELAAEQADQEGDSDE